MSDFNEYAFNLQDDILALKCNDIAGLEGKMLFSRVQNLVGLTHKYVKSSKAKQVLRMLDKTVNNLLPSSNLEKKALSSPVAGKVELFLRHKTDAVTNTITLLKQGWKEMDPKQIKETCSKEEKEIMDKWEKKMLKLAENVEKKKRKPNVPVPQKYSSALDDVD